MSALFQKVPKVSVVTQFEEDKTWAGSRDHKQETFELMSQERILLSAFWNTKEFIRDYRFDIDEKEQFQLNRKVTKDKTELLDSWSPENIWIIIINLLQLWIQLKLLWTNLKLEV